MFFILLTSILTLLISGGILIEKEVMPIGGILVGCGILLLFLTLIIYITKGKRKKKGSRDGLLDCEDFFDCDCGGPDCG